MFSASRYSTRKRLIATMTMSLVSLLCLGGCGNTVESLGGAYSFQLDGFVHSAGIPISGAEITVFSAGVAGDRTASQLLSDVSLVSNESGTFHSSKTYSCTTPTNIVYVVATGGNVQGWEKNARISLLAVLGTCSALASASHADISEQSTVAAVWPLAPYTVSAKQIGFESETQEQLTAAVIRQLQDSLSYHREVRAVRTLNAAANALSSCLQSAGGQAGDGTACGSLFSAVKTQDEKAPQDTLQATIAAAKHAEEPLPELYRLAASQKEFHPALSSAPADWEVAGAHETDADDDSTGTPASSDPDTNDGSTSTSGKKRRVELKLQPKNTSVGSSIAATINLEKAREVAVTFTLKIGAPEVLSPSSTEVTFLAGQSTASVTLKGLSVGVSSVELEGRGYKTAKAEVHVWAPAIPRSFFGMTVKDYKEVMPTVSFGTTRSWDAGDEDAADDISWSSLNPAANVYDFDRLDRFITVNEARNADMIYTFGRTPQWASSQPVKATPYGPGQCAPPKDLALWDAYVSAIVQHANGRIRYWELWNEPNSQDFYCGDMPTLVTMAQHAYRIIKEIEPGAMVLSPAMTSSAGPSWLGYFLWLGGSGFVDVIAFHGYSSAQAEDIESVVNKYRSVMAANGTGNLPLWDTEASWAGNGDLPTPPMNEQTAFIAKYYLLQQSLGVDRFIWYAYDGGGTWGGLWSQVGGASQAATAYAAIYSWMVGQVLTSPCSLGKAGLWRCGLTDPATGAKAYVVWSASGTKHVGFEGNDVYVETLAHERYAVSLGIDVNQNPVLLRGAKTVPVVVGVQ